MQSGTTKQRLLAAMLSLSMIFTTVGLLIESVNGSGSEGMNAGAGTYAAAGLPIVHFDFEGEGTDALANKSGYAGYQDVSAVIVNDSDSNIAGDGSNHYLDLTVPSDEKAYLSVPGNILQGLDEMTVEMRVWSNDTSKANWAFYAAPDGSSPVLYNEKYLGVFLENNIRVERYANTGTRPASIEYPRSYSDGQWHKVRIVFAKDATYLYADDVQCAVSPSSYSLKDCVSSGGNCDSSVLYFGFAPWVLKDADGEGFNGYIDDIKIWAYAMDTEDPHFEGNESDYIITKDVVEPENTVVNMFDYWITTQTENDYRPDNVASCADIMSGAINAGHPFLFAGWDSIKHTYSSIPIPSVTNPANRVSLNDYVTGNYDLVNTIGSWNDNKGNAITAGIVDSLLGEDGYPHLSGSMANTGVLPADVRTNDKLTESLAYLFDPNTPSSGKASYPDVTGLFRLKNGYYYFDSAATFAELNIQDEDSPKRDHSDNGGNKITLYGGAQIGADPANIEGVWRPYNPQDITQRSRGQFFPFNDWSDLFHLENGALVQNHDHIYYQNMPGNEQINHYFGMTVETRFVQPINGMVNHGQDEMIFEFSGDDDVWIFVDDVLVCDIGGMHAKLTAKVNFATGAITLTAPNAGDIDVVKPTTLAQVFTNAGKYKPGDFNGSTFASGTTHTLKFFYLERGNNVSNAYINFNFQNIQPDIILKSNESGQPLAGAKFELYPARLKDPANTGAKTAAEFDIIGGTANPIASIATDINGGAEFLDDEGNIIVFADMGYNYYILRETQAPAGYRKNGDIVLRYDWTTHTFTVVNKYETGAFASFSAYFEQISSDVHKAEYKKGYGIDQLSSTADPNELAKGLAFVVPTKLEGGEWLPLYGSNSDKWETVALGVDYRLALLEAVLRQIAKDGAPEMYMTWNSGSERLSAALEDVPGNAGLYTGNQGGILSQATLFISENGLNTLGITNTAGKDSSQLFEELKDKLKNGDLDTALSKVSSMAGSLDLLYTDDFERTYRSDIHIMDMPQKLVIRKADTQGNPLNGAEFALYSNVGSAAEAKNENIIASDRTDADGILTLTFANGLADGQYWLRETTAPEGYQRNDNLIQVIVENSYIYANATAYTFGNGKATPVDTETQDNVKVYAAVGSLAPSMVRFTDDDILNDIQLKEITGEVHTAAQANSDHTLNWGGSTKAFDPLYFSQSASFNYTLLDYAAVQSFDPDDYEDRDAMLEALGMVEAENGFVCVKPVKEGADLSSMFSLLNIVEVADEEKVDIDIEKDQKVNSGNRTTDRLIVREGDNVTYYLTITVTGKDNALLKGIVVQDMVPDGLELLESVSGSVTPAKEGARFSSFIVQDEDGSKHTYVQWILGTAKVGDKYTLSYTAKVPHVEESTTWDNTAYVISGYEDKNPPDCPRGPKDPKHPGRWKPSNTVEIYCALGSWPPIITKEVAHREWADDETFEFALELVGPADGVTKMPENITVSKTEPSKQFGEVAFNKADTYIFRIREVPYESSGSLIFDKGYYELEVTVTHDENDSGKLNAVVSRVTRFESDEDEGTEYGGKEYSFKNTYSATAQLTVPIEKTLNGKQWANERFDFAIAAAANSPETAKAIEDGYIVIAENPVTLDASHQNGSFGLTFKSNGLSSYTYVFTVSEINGRISGITYDTNKYTLTVEVRDDMKGKLTVSASYSSAGGNAAPLGANRLMFVNTYKEVPKPGGNTPTDPDPDPEETTTTEAETEPEETTTEAETEPEETTAETETEPEETTEPAVTVPAPSGPTTSGPTSPNGTPEGERDPNSLNLDDDGLPRGDLDLNMPTGTAIGGKAYIAVGVLLLAASAVVVGKRRRDRNDKH